MFNDGRRQRAHLEHLPFTRTLLHTKPNHLWRRRLPGAHAAVGLIRFRPWNSDVVSRTSSKSSQADGKSPLLQHRDSSKMCRERCKLCRGKLSLESLCSVLLASLG